MRRAFLGAFLGSLLAIFTAWRVREAAEFRYQSIRARAMVETMRELHS